ncbi:MAG: hypothetical protein HFF04_03285 [Oscillospiraceae bacterium]|nr:hypothetical protein [Oscillospiraceae bacterium]
MRRNKVLGTLYGAAYGDSLGAITEFRSRRDIAQAFPGGYRTYAPSISFITSEITPGCVTDDFGSSCYFMQKILRHEGDFDRGIAVEAVLEWSNDPIVFAKYAGRNTKSAMERLKEGTVIDEEARKRHFGQANTNGAAMKVSPIGLLARGDQELAVQYALDLAYPTHYNSAAASAAAAIACAIAAAQGEDATLDGIFSAAVEGCRKARLQVEEEGCAAFGPFTEEHIKWAIQMGQACESTDALLNVLEGQIGTGISVQESIPAVFAIIAGTKGDFHKALFCASNAGGDTDTISSMTGAILGGLHGVEVLREEDIRRIQEVNAFLCLQETVEAFADLICN